jgi:fructosamine-3-kinase
LLRLLANGKLLEQRLAGKIVPANNNPQKINIFQQTFYARNRLETQIKRIQEKVTIHFFNAVSKQIFAQHGDRELDELWSELQLRIPLFFGPDTEMRPALLHGDLWSGNAAQTSTEPGMEFTKWESLVC